MLTRLSMRAGMPSPRRHARRACRHTPASTRGACTSTRGGHAGTGCAISTRLCISARPPGHADTVMHIKTVACHFHPEPCRHGWQVCWYGGGMSRRLSTVPTCPPHVNTVRVVPTRSVCVDMAIGLLHTPVHRHGSRCVNVVIASRYTSNPCRRVVTTPTRHACGCHF